PAAALVHEPGADEKLGIDRHRQPVTHEDSRRHGREAVPRGEQSARFVERSGDEAAVHQSRPGLVPFVEREKRLVLGETFDGRLREPDAAGCAAAAPAGWVVVRRDYAFVGHTFSNVPKRSSWS